MPGSASLLLGALLLACRDPEHLDSEDVQRTARDATWRWYTDLLRGRDVSLEADANPFGGAAAWVFEALAYVLATQPAPAASFQAIWDALYPQRVRAVTIRRDFDSSASCEHLLRSGRSALDWLLSPTAIRSDRRDCAAPLWRALYSAAHVSWANAYDEPRPCTRTLETLFGYLVPVFEDAWCEPFAGCAPDSIADDRLAVCAARYVIRSHVDRATVVRVASDANVHLRAALECLHEVASSTDGGNPSDTNSADVEGWRLEILGPG